MRAGALSHLTDTVLMRKLHDASARDRSTLAELLVLIGEADARKSYLVDGYSCMFHFCRDELHMADGEAYWRVRAARLARRHPGLLGMIQRGEIHLTAIALLSKHLRHGNTLELLEAAKFKTKAQIQLMLAQRFPQPDVCTFVRPLSAAARPDQPVPSAAGPDDNSRAPLLLATVPDDTLTDAGESGAVSPVPPSPDRNRIATTDPATVSIHFTQAPDSRPTRVTPRAPGRYALQTMLDETEHEDLRAVQALLSHVMPTSDIGRVLGRALAMCRQMLEKQRCAATDKPRPHTERRSEDPRHMPASVRRAVWKRDQHRCTHIGARGHRCEERGMLELDHVIPVARGGAGTLQNLRPRCRAHNQYEAERVYGAKFMQSKRTHT